MKKFLCAILIGTCFFTACSTQPITSDTQEQATTATEETEEILNAEYEIYKNWLLTTSDYMPQLEEVVSGDTVAVLTTSMGEIKIKLCPEEAPKAVENFVALANEGFYEGIIFHRVIQEFMNQSGDPEGNGTGGQSIWGESFADEFSPYMYHFTGALAMANHGPDTNGSQFYIVQKEDVTAGFFDLTKQIIEEHGADQLLYNSSLGKIVRTNYDEAVIEKYNELGGVPDLDYGYTIFGQVIEGMNVVRDINQVETNAMDKPVNDVVIEKIEIITVD